MGQVQELIRLVPGERHGKYGLAERLDMEQQESMGGGRQSWLWRIIKSRLWHREKLWLRKG